MFYFTKETILTFKNIFQFLIFTMGLDQFQYAPSIFFFGNHNFHESSMYYIFLYPPLNIYCKACCFFLFFKHYCGMRFTS